MYKKLVESWELEPLKCDIFKDEEKFLKKDAFEIIFDWKTYCVEGDVDLKDALYSKHAHIFVAIGRHASIVFWRQGLKFLKSVVQQERNWYIYRGIIILEWLCKQNQFKHTISAINLKSK